MAFFMYIRFDLKLYFLKIFKYYWMINKKIREKSGDTFWLDLGKGL